MTMKDVRAKAKNMGVNLGKRSKADAIRLIQTTEGNQPCYCTGFSESCGQYGCCFREDCV